MRLVPMLGTLVFIELIVFVFEEIDNCKLNSDARE